MPTAMSQKSLSLLCWKLLEKLDVVKHQRFEWILEAREKMLSGWRQGREGYREWLQEVNREVDDLKAAGDTDGAAWLVDSLLREPLAFDNAKFEVTVPTGHGSEVWVIKGFPEGEHPPSSFGVAPSQPAAENKTSDSSHEQAEEHPAHSDLCTADDMTADTSAQPLPSPAMEARPSSAPPQLAGSSAHGPDPARRSRHTVAPVDHAQPASRSQKEGSRHRRLTEAQKLAAGTSNSPYTTWDIHAVRDELKTRGIPAHAHCNRKTLVKRLLNDDAGRNGKERRNTNRKRKNQARSRTAEDAGREIPVTLAPGGSDATLVVVESKIQVEDPEPGQDVSEQTAKEAFCGMQVSTVSVQGVPEVASESAALTT